MAVVMVAAITAVGTPQANALTYTVVDTGQTTCYDNTTTISAPSFGQAFYGQDAHNLGNLPSYTTSGDGLTVYDNNTGLTWQQSYVSSKLTFAEAQTYHTTLNNQNYGGYDDWRLPTIKELYSLSDYRGIDPSGYTGTDTSGLTPFIDTNYFAFEYGDTSAGERIIDAQYWSSTKYVSTTMGGDPTTFGFNFADGRIKGYGTTTPMGEMAAFARYVRGNTNYGINDFVDNGNATISDSATGLMWSESDSGVGMNWEEALAWVQQRNAENYLGHDDWRLPNVKELQSIVDYTRSPDTTSSAAIDPIFDITAIVNEGDETDYPFFWTGTTHKNIIKTGEFGAYIAFGKGLGWMEPPVGGDRVLISLAPDITEAILWGVNQRDCR